MKNLILLFFATSFLFGEPVEKAGKYHELLLKNADNETLMTRFLDAWLDEGDRESLEKWLVAEAEKGGVEERRVLGRYLDHVGARERALEEYEAVLKLEPGDVKTQLAVAKLQAGDLDFEGALKTLGEREDVEAVTLRGAWAHRLGRTKVALELWRGLLARKPGDRELREDLVSLFREEGLGKEARDLQAELIAMGGDPFQGALDRLDLGDLQLENGLKEEALGSYRTVLAASGSGSWLEREALYKLSEIFRRERDAEGLRVFLATLREEMPHRLALQKSFARQLVITGEEDEGMAAFREVLRRTPGDESLRLEFVELLAFAERYEEAAEEMAALIATKASAERWLRLAELREEFDEENVLEALGEVEKLKVGEAAGVLEMARIYGRFDLDEEALRVLETGRGESREISEALAILLVELKRDDEALAIWRAMIDEGGVEEVLRVVPGLRRLGLREEAFAFLGEYRGELSGKFEGLRLYCELAFEVGEVEDAWVGVREWVTLAETFSELQVAVNLGSVIGRTHGLEAAISELEKVEEENGLCLLATLQQLAGRLTEADATLERVEGELARRHEVVLLTQRGDHAGAIARLRGMMGERVSLVQRRQLLDLLERSGDFAGALAEAEQWKISSPGEVAAWRKRATLLVRLGRQAEAADELRRARNKFDKNDVDLTRELARMQLPLGRHREALRLYEHLFRTAKSDEGRLGFIDEMFAAAREAGLQDEMVARFEREQMAAVRELFPLRVLARLYKLSSDRGSQQEVLLKLHRLLPDDEKVLFELVALAEQNNDKAGARQLLLEFAARNRSAGILQRLASMQIRAGEVEDGLEILGKIAPGDLKASDVEATGVSLWQLGEHGLAMEFLEKNEVVVSADWRLGFLRADFLETVGRMEEARGIWVELLGVEGALGRSLSGNQRRNFIPNAGQMNQRYWWRLFEEDPFASRARGNQLALGLLPNDTNEVRWLSLMRLAKASLREDASGESWEGFLETVNHPWMAEVRGWGLFPKKEIRPVVAVEEVKMTPERRSQDLVGEPESSREDFLKLAAEVADEKPELANRCRIYAAFKMPEGAEQLEELRAVAVLISEEDDGGMRNAQVFTKLVGLSRNDGLFPSFVEERPSSEQQEKLKQLEPWWESWMERAMIGKLGLMGGNAVLFPLASQRLSGDIEGLLVNLDRLTGAKAIPNQVAGLQARFSQPLMGMPDRFSLRNHFAARHWVYGLVNQVFAPQVLSPNLLEKARDLGWKPKGYEKLAEFAKEIPQVKDRFLRTLLFHRIGMEKEFLAEMEALGREGTFEDKLDVLALRRASSQRGENVELLRALLAMERDGLSPADLNLLDAVTLGEAMKCRRLDKVDGETRTTLVEILRGYTKGPAGRSKALMLQSLYSPLGLTAPKRNRQAGRTQSRQRQSYRQLLSAKNGEKSRRTESELERTERNFLSRLEACFSSRNTLAYLRQVVSRGEFRDLKAKVLEVYKPGESRSYLKRYRYAQLCLAYDEREKARAVLAELEAERPYDFGLGILSLFAREAEEQTAELDEILESGEIGKVIDLLTKLAGMAEDEETFFDAYERLVVLLEKRAGEFQLKDAERILREFKNLQGLSKSFGKRSLLPMSRPLPRLKKGEDAKEGNWAVRVRQRKIIIDAFGEMMRLRSIRGGVLRHLKQSQEALKLDDGNVEWMVFDALEKEPVMEVDLKLPALGGETSDAQLALKAVLDSKKFSGEWVDALVRHDFFKEREGALMKAALEEDAEKVETLLAEYQKEPQLPLGALLETLLRAERWEEPMREKFGQAMAGLKSEEAVSRAQFYRLCELGSLKDSLAALEEVAAAHFPAAEKHEGYLELKEGGALPPEIEEKIATGQSLFGALQNVPRAWIPLLTFLKKSDQAVWVTLDEGKIREQLRQRLDVMYKLVFYDRLRAEGFGGYDGLALLGEERLTKTGELSSWLERLISPLKLAPTEGQTYWLRVSEDCREQVEEVSYLEAFIAVRKDFKIDDEGRRNLLRKVLESELEELSGLGEGQLRGLANLVGRDFPKLEIAGASGELEKFLKRLRGFPAEGVVERIKKTMAGSDRMAALKYDEATGLCTRLAAEGEVELAAEFWVTYAYAKTKKRDGRGRDPGLPELDFGQANFRLLTRKPFMGTLNLVDSVRFVRLVQEALEESPELAKSITYTRDMLKWRDALSRFSGHKDDPVGVVAFLDEMLGREGVTEVDKRVMGGFLIKANVSGRFREIPVEVFRLRLEGSALAGHSPGVVKTMLALSQLQGVREKEEDAKAMKVLFDYLGDEKLAPDFRADLAESIMGKLERDEALLELADAEPVGVALRDLLLRGRYGVTGSLSNAGPMMHFVNQHLDTVPPELQREIYERWIAALKVDAREVLTEKVVVKNRSLRLFDVIFDFTDGGRRFPLPQEMIGELARSFSGDLETMQRLIRTGNDELVTGLLPDADGGFRLNKREYSTVTLELENEVLPKLPAEYQVRLKCYLASLRDERAWKEKEESEGHLQHERALAAARIFVANLPEEQAVRLRAIKQLENSFEALKVLIPLFEDELQNDMAAFAKSRRGDIRYMLRWVKAGGAKTVSSFAPDADRPLRIIGVRGYDEALAELESLLVPSLGALERMRLTCSLAVLSDSEMEDGNEGGFPSHDSRMKRAARYILENPLPGAYRDEEKKCIAKLVRSGLPEAEAQALLRRDSMAVEKLDVAALAALPLADAELVAFQLRAFIAKGEAAAAMTCLRVLADSKAEISEKQRAQLINLILPKITLPLLAHVTRKEAGEKELGELKELGTKFFAVTFSRRTQVKEVTQRAVLFLSFATHCLAGDKDGFEALKKAASDQGRLSLKRLTEKQRRHGGFLDENVFHILPTAQPLYFDGKNYHAEELKPLRELLFAKIGEHSFAGTDEMRMVALLSSLNLTLADVDPGKDAFASDRGNIDVIYSAILAGDDALFLALLPTAAEAYFQRNPPMENGQYYEHRHRARMLLHRLEEHWSGSAWTEVLDLIENDFQRMHLEIYLQSVLQPHVTKGALYDMEKWDAETEDEILKLLPEFGPARAQILARLGRVIEPGSKLAKVLVAQAGAKGFDLRKMPGGLDSMAKIERLEMFFSGWVCALHAGDWSVMDRQLPSEAVAPMVEFLTRCARVQGLFQVAGDPGGSAEVFEKLSEYGLKKTAANFQAWLEVIGLVAEADASRWKDGLQTLDANQKKLAQAEMAAELRVVLGLLSNVNPPIGRSFASYRRGRSSLMKFWLHPSAREKSARVLAAVMDDDLGLFSATGISAEERARMLIKAFDWSQMKTCLETRFEGEVEIGLLTELALEGQVLAESRDDFQAFIEKRATQVAPGSPDGSRLWLKVARQRISAGNLEGAKAAREMIDFDHFEDRELKALNRQIESLEGRSR